ncbi:elongation factor P 5-aminopentanone reductase [Butyrivibrio proteoclasticus]|uniref:elongation factor P 5-aminopentanone reductase n=1 Tax=Butyrivibrio proteoclasticus TaxID=43305 RepID=UPI000478FA3B|nr:SDR family NAD(P)-dependent oxidoreductase [Butyrivibrio proteoclasticus]
MGRKILITGASRGIGRAIAEQFASLGDDLYLTCIHNKEKLESLSKELSDRYHVQCKTFVCDCGDSPSVKELFSQIGDIDVVINNAGVAHIGLLSDMTDDEWRRLMSTNLDSVFYTSRAAIPLMLKKHSGRIVNITSVWGSVGASCEVAYSASKGGVNSFTRALAKELAPSGIAVNAVSCGVIDTDMNRDHLSEEDLEELKGEIPADRLGDPKEVAQVVAKVCEMPVYMTGQIITVDGGWI